MTKIRNTPPQIQRYDQPQNTSNINNEHNQNIQTDISVNYNSESLSEMRAMRDGIDYEALMKYDLDHQYHKGNNGIGWGKGGKKGNEESLEAELMAIIEEQQAQAELARNEIIQEEIKNEEIKREDIRDAEIKTDERKTEIKLTDRKNTELNEETLSESLNPATLKRT